MQQRPQRKGGGVCGPGYRAPNPAVHFVPQHDPRFDSWVVRGWFRVHESSVSIRAGGGEVDVAACHESNRFVGRLWHAWCAEFRVQGPSGSLAHRGLEAGAITDVTIERIRRNPERAGDVPERPRVPADGFRDLQGM